MIFLGSPITQTKSNEVDNPEDFYYNHNYHSNISIFDYKSVIINQSEINDSKSIYRGNSIFQFTDPIYRYHKTEINYHDSISYYDDAKHNPPLMELHLIDYKNKFFMSHFEYSNEKIYSDYELQNFCNNNYNNSFDKLNTLEDGFVGNKKIKKFNLELIQTSNLKVARKKFNERIKEMKAQITFKLI